MRKERQRIELGAVSRSEAKILQYYIKSYRHAFKNLAKQIEKELEPYYEYEVECTCCGRKYISRNNKEIPEEELNKLKKDAECIDCEDDT